MNIHRSIHRTILTNMLAVVFISIFLMSLLLMWSQNSSFNHEIAHLREDYITSQTNLVKKEVEMFVDYAQHQKSQIQKQLSEKLKNRVNEAYDIAWNLYRENKSTLSEQAIKKLIVDALRPIRFLQGRAYYFCIDEKGVAMLLPSDPKLEGKNIADWMNADGHLVIKAMLDTAKTKQEGFIEYYWKKWGGGTHEYRKYTFVKRFEPYNWVIGAGEYFDNIERDVLQEVNERLSTRRFGKEQQDYLFALSPEGLMLANGGMPKFVGNSVWNLEDTKGKRFVQEMIQKATVTPAGDFVEYHWLKPPTMLDSLKVAFVKKVEGWGFIVGAGFYLDDLETTLIQKRRLLSQHIEKTIVKAFIIILLLAILVSVIAKSITIRIKDGFDNFFNFFQKAATDYVPIASRHLHFSEFITLATLANRMLTSIKESEEKIKKNQERFDLVIKGANAGIWDWQDVNSDYIWMSPKFYELAGYSESELNNSFLKFMTLVHSDDRKLIEANIKTYLTERTYFNVEFRIRLKSGGYKWFNGSGQAQWDQKGNPLRMVGALSDIDERKQVEKQVEKAKNQLRDAIDSLNVGLVMYDKDENLVVCNQRYKEIYSLSSEKMMPGTPYREILEEYCRQGGHLHTGMSADSWVAERLQAHRNPSGRQIEQKLNNRWIIINDQLTSEGGIVSLRYDITERKRMEEEIRTSEKRYRELINSLEAGVLLCTPDTQVELCNPIACRLLGSYEEQLLGERLKDGKWHFLRDNGTILSPDEYPFNQVVTKKSPLRGLVMGVYRSATKNTTWLLVNAVPIFDEQEQLTQIIVSFIDITEHKQAQEAIRSSEELFKAVFNNAAVGMTLVTLEGRFLKVNSRWATMLGYFPEELVQMTINDINDHNSDIDSSVKIKQLVTKEIDSFQLEKRYIRKDKTAFWASLWATLLYNSKGDQLSLLGVVTDITERKEAEIRLQSVLSELNHFKTTLDLTADGVFMFSPDTLKFFYVNQGAISYTGYSEEELLQRGPLDVNTELTPRALKEVLAMLVEDKLPSVRIETTERRKNGTLLPVEVSLQYIPVTENDSRFVAIVRDISERKHAEYEQFKRQRFSATLVEIQHYLLASEEIENNYHHILQLMGEVTETSRVYLFENHKGSDGQIVMSQRAEWCMCGIQAKINNLELQNLPYEPNFSRWLTVLYQGDVIEGTLQEFPNVERELLELQGVKSILVIPILIKNELFGFIGFDDCEQPRQWEQAEIDLLRTVSTSLGIGIERKQAQEQLRQQNEMLVKLNQDKNEFLGIAAHDLKNPLSGILGLSEEMIESLDDLSKEELMKFAKMIQMSSRKMFQLIANLLDVNVIESGGVQVMLEQVDLLPILQQLIEQYTERARVKNITLHFHTTDEYYPALADKSTTHQVLDNLISNAVKYSPHGKQVNIYLNNKGNSVQCEIQDEGEGLSQEDQQKLFGKFTRLTTKPTGGEHSTGLGLFIVKKLLEAMNGKVWCESELGQGAKFVVEFPVKPLHDLN